MKAPIAILSYNENQYSETFIHGLVKRLPFGNHLLYSGGLPEYFGNGQKFLNDDGFKKVSIAIKEWMGSSKYQQHQERVEAYLIKHKIRAVLANYSITAIPVMDICRRNNIALIPHFWGWTAYRKTILDQYGSQYGELFGISKAVICVSQDMKQQLINLGCAEGKIRVIASGADTDIFRYENRSANPNIFLAVGRFCDTKNPHLTMLAFSKVVKEIPDARLLFGGGDENLLNACINLAKALKISDKVEFCGILKPEAVYEKMRTALAFVQHSAVTILNEKEGTPVAIMEACAAGLPVIATRHAGITDVIIDGETGLLCEEFDIDTMAANMIKICKDRQLAAKLGENASRRIHEQFTTQQYIEKVAAVIEASIF